MISEMHLVFLGSVMALSLWETNTPKASSASGGVGVFFVARAWQAWITASHPSPAVVDFLVFLTSAAVETMFLAALFPSPKAKKLF